MKHYFRANPGTIFILAFQILLVSAAVLLASGNSVYANEIAIYGFYALVLGIVIQIGVVVREERKRTRGDASTNSEAR